ncbi:LOW QUALITY PROTEIN: SFTA3 isoform 1 [Pongo abelii]|uniref:SFTA3 isoform 1 n=1 Tax=Pongo abelii TaxID=9601 RepID=A0A2J8V9C1_PONAB|nr:LOW QUALITY PROTEIN: SFTA3 isoform 1 [Pongo abelii]
MRAGFSDFQLIRDQVLFLQDQAQRLTEWLQLSGFENPVSESTTLCPREREKRIPTCVAVCVPSPAVHTALLHPTTLSQSRSSSEAEMLIIHTA